jgi:hypothetical protein
LLARRPNLVGAAVLANKWAVYVVQRRQNFMSNLFRRIGSDSALRYFAVHEQSAQLHAPLALLHCSANPPALFAH